MGISNPTSTIRLFSSRVRLESGFGISTVPHRQIVLRHNGKHYTCSNRCDVSGEAQDMLRPKDGDGKYSRRDPDL